MINFTSLENRGVIRLTGPDRLPFLKGLITGCVDKISPTQGIYSLLLTPQGRIRYDFFISEHENQWFIDSHKDYVPPLLSILNMYKLRCSVALEDVTNDYKVYAQWSNHKATTETLQPKVDQALSCFLPISYQDPRLEEMGKRFIFSHNQNVTSFFKDKNKKTEEDYNFHRLQWGVPEMGTDMICEKSIPLECGLDELQAIDWKKGCYLGQELTARTRYRGLVRKRLIPVTFEGENATVSSLILPGISVLQNNQPVGDVRSFQNPYGLVYLRLEALTAAEPLIVNGLVVTPFLPYWIKLPSLDEGKNV